jgi:hypothetical protein
VGCKSQKKKKKKKKKKPVIAKMRTGRLLGLYQTISV